MARTDVAVEDLNASALTGLSFKAANTTTGIADGHKFLNDGNVFVLVEKSSDSGDITFVTPVGAGPGKDPIEDRAYTVETTDVPLVCGPFDPEIFNQSDGKVYINYEAGEEAEFEIFPVKMTGV